jgi:predicted RNase H-like HicB family nuclease
MKNGSLLVQWLYPDKRGFIMSTLPREFFVIIERDEDGMYVGEVPQFRACYSQGRTIDELMSNIREVIVLCLEEADDEGVNEFVGVQKILV